MFNLEKCLDFFGFENGRIQLDQSIYFVLFARYTYWKDDFKHSVNVL